MEGVIDSAGVIYKVVDGGGGSLDSSFLWIIAVLLSLVWRIYGSKLIIYGSKIGEFN